MSLDVHRVVLVTGMTGHDLQYGEDGGLILRLDLRDECPIDDVRDVVYVSRALCGRRVLIAAEIDEMRQRLQHHVLHVLGRVRA